MQKKKAYTCSKWSINSIQNLDFKKSADSGCFQFLGVSFFKRSKILIFRGFAVEDGQKSPREKTNKYGRVDDQNLDV